MIVVENSLSGRIVALIPSHGFGFIAEPGGMAAVSGIFLQPLRTTPLVDARTVGAAARVARAAGRGEPGDAAEQLHHRLGCPGARANRKQGLRVPFFSIPAWCRARGT